MKNALIIIDLQNDFLLCGALPVPEGDQVIVPINQLLKLPFNIVVASKDWHPLNHCSFAINHAGKKEGERIQLEEIEQILWPEHCVQNSQGADFPSQLNSDQIQKVFYKGSDPNIDSYSAFFDNRHLKATGMGDFLKQNQVELLFFTGIATEYCVKYSVLDALALGFKTILIQDSCRGINAQDASAACIEMQSKGALLVSSSTLIDRFRRLGTLGLGFI